MPESCPENPTDFALDRQGLLQIINALPNAIAVLNHKAAILFANGPFLTLFNRNKSEIIGRKIGKAFGCHYYSDECEEDCALVSNSGVCALKQGVMTALKQKDACRDVEITIKIGETEEKELIFSTLPVTLNGDDVALLTIEDVTKNRHHEMLRIEKEKLSAVMKTVGAVCHEINQPLMIVMGLSEMLLEDLPKDHAMHESIRKIMNQADRMGQITKKLMSITRYRTKPYLKGEILDIDSASSPSPPAEP